MTDTFSVTLTPSPQALSASIVTSGPMGPPGPAGTTGSQGPAGPGVAAGGTANQVLAKIDATNYNTQWINQSAGLTLPLTQTLTWSPDNTYDLGASGANRPRTIYVGTSVVTPLLVTPLLAPTGNVVEQRNGTNPQTLRIFNTYTDASNYERAEFNWSSNYFTVGTVGAGTGNNNRGLILRSNLGIYFNYSSGTYWQVSSGTGGHFLAGTDNTVDIGASGATRPRNIFAASGLYTAMNTVAQGPAIWGGSGVPAAGLGANGDVFHRSDTPATSLQRIYVKSAGAWVGIV